MKPAVVAMRPITHASAIPTHLRTLFMVEVWVEE
jgi:hypothetical protein